MRALPELQSNVAVTHDRTCDELGEERNIGGKVNEVSLCRRVAAINVDDIAEHLEGVEADADGKAQLQKRQGKSRGGIDAGKEEICILEIAEQPKAHKDRERQKDLRRPLPAVLFNQQAEEIPLRDGDEHQNDIFRLAPGVEEKTYEQQRRVFQPARHQKVEQQRRRQKIKEKGNAGKEHGRLLPFKKSNQTMGSSQTTEAPENAAVTFSLNSSTSSSAPKQETT